MSRSHAFAICAVLPCLAGAAFAGTLNVPKDFKTIPAALDAARPGDTILVEAGTYSGPVRMKERVTLRSAGDDADGQQG